MPGRDPAVDGRPAAAASCGKARRDAKCKARDCWKVLPREAVAAFRAECEATEPTTSSAAEAARLRRLSTKNVICCASRAASTQAAPRSGQASLRELGLRILLPAPSPVTQWAPGLPSCRTFGLRHLLQTALKHLAANRAEEVAGLMLRKPWRPKTSFGFCCVGCSRALVEDRGAGRV